MLKTYQFKTQCKGDIRILEYGTVRYCKYHFARINDRISVNTLTCTSEIIFELGDTNCSNQHAFELEYDFVHVRVFTYILS